jgi:ankyrin repeat protein
MTDEGENQDMQFFESNGPLNSGSHPSNNAPAVDDDQSMTTDGQLYGARQVVLTQTSHNDIVSASGDQSEEKLVFRLIYRSDQHQADALIQHLNDTKDRIDVTNIFDRGGYSPLNYAAYKDRYMAFKALIDFVKRDESESDQVQTTVSGHGANSNSTRNRFRLSLRKWIDLKEKGQSGFAAVHFASFNGNLRMLNDLIKLGADVHATNP